MLMLIDFLNQIIFEFQNKTHKNKYIFDKQLFVTISAKKISFQISPNQKYSKDGCKNKKICCHVDLLIQKSSKRNRSVISSVGCKEIHFVDILMNCTLYFYSQLDISGPLLITDCARKEQVHNILFYNARKFIAEGKNTILLDSLSSGIHYYSKWGFQFSWKLDRLLIQAIEEGRSDQYLQENFSCQTGYWMPTTKKSLIKNIKKYKIVF